MIAFKAKSLGLSVAQARGRDAISHPDRGHDDVANAVAGAAYATSKGKYAYDTTMQWVG
jgi:hypothetical protein